MGDVRAGRLRHVAGGAGIVRRLARCVRLPAVRQLVTAQTPLPVELLLGGRGWRTMRVVARGTAEATAARGRAPADRHLLHLPDRFVEVRKCRVPDVDRDEQVERQAGSKIKRLAVATIDSLSTLEVTLPADILAQIRGQVPGVHDAGVDSTSNRATVGLLLDVQGARPVTALAPDRSLPAQKWFLEPVESPRDWLDLVDVTKQTPGCDRTKGVPAGSEPGRHVPDLLLRKPTHPRLPEGTLARAEVRPAARAGTDARDYCGVRPRYLATGAVLHRFRENERVAPPFDPVVDMTEGGHLGRR